MTKISTTPSLALALIVGAALSTGCAQQSRPAPETARMGCDPATQGDGAKSLAPGKVVAVSPVKEKVFLARALQFERTVGADLYVRAEPGMSAEYLERALTCHAQGAEPVHSNDPLHPGTGVVHVKVESANGGFAVRATGSTDEAGRAIWKRAEALTRPVQASEGMARSSSTASL
jgi:hypothetical protein